MSGERGHVTLRPWRADEAPQLVSICDDAEVASRTPFPSPFTESFAQTFVDGRDGYLDLAIVDELDVPVGLATLNLTTRSASYVVGADARRRGFATRALEALCAIARDELGLRSVVLEIEPGNRPSEIVAARCGFRRVDAAPEQVEDKGRAYSLATWERTLTAAAGSLGDRTPAVALREVVDSDIEVFLEHQSDPLAVEMAAFPARERDQFWAHWAKVRAVGANITRTVVADGSVAGNIGCWPQDSQQLVGYWIGRAWWGRGVATQALTLLLDEVPIRPLHAHVAKHNIGSIRVLEKCGFRRDSAEDAQTIVPDDGIEEIVLVLDA